jgi:hypothetical protein
MINFHKKPYLRNRFQRKWRKRIKGNLALFENQCNIKTLHLLFSDLNDGFECWVSFRKFICV